jgi:hypothetical protein
MTRRTLTAALGLAALGLVAFGWAARPNQRRPDASPTTAAGRTGPANAQGDGRAPASVPTRDLFQFGDQGPAATGPVEPQPTTPPTVPAADPTPAPRARLVGFVRTPTAVKAALSLDGRVEVVALHEERSGFRVLALDADDGRVRVLSPEGQELELTLSAP